MSYSWSIWYVPTEWKEIMSTYDMEHIPHVTWETNIEMEPLDLPERKFIDELIVDGPLVQLKSEYDNDPISDAVGVYCHKPDWWDKSHRPHMTLKYNSTDMAGKYIPLEFQDLYVTVADTRDIDPKKWRLA